MEKSSGSRTDRKNCSVCGCKTGYFKRWSYKDGIEITVPVCQKCNDRIGWCLEIPMDIHLKGIRESVRQSIIITGDEKYIMELDKKLAEMKGGA